MPLSGIPDRRFTYAAHVLPVCGMDAASGLRAGGGFCMTFPSHATKGGRPRSFDLTAKERHVSTLIAQGLTQAEIGRQLGVTRAAVSSTVQRSLARIGASKTYELIKYIREVRT